MRQVIYHAACPDGWCSAWVAHMRYPEAQLFGAYHNTPPPDVKGNDVLLTDYCYPRPLMEQLVKDAKSVTVLDHHKTAQEALEGLTGADITFDMQRSGAGITWDTLFPDRPRPWIVSYTEDRDLWRWALPDSKAVCAYLSTIPFTMEAWSQETEPGRLERAVTLGSAITAKTAQYVTEVSKNARQLLFEGHTVPVVNAPHVDISEVLAHLALTAPFAVGWHQRSDGLYSYSLRSTGIDVAAIAQKYGGGGHQKAAGFQSSKLLF